VSGGLLPLDGCIDPCGGPDAPPPVVGDNPYINNFYAHDGDVLVGVDAITGAFSLQTTDLMLGGASPLAFGRFYNSLSTSTGILGPGWRDSYGYTLTRSDASVDLTTPEGLVFTFILDEDGMYLTPDNADFTLTQTANGYLLVYRDQTRLTFTAAGPTTYHVTTITPPTASTTTLTYSGAGLTLVSNRSGTMKLTYASGRIIRVDDTAGRQVSYGYDPQGRLVSVTDADQRVTQYRYDSNNYLVQIVNGDGVAQVEQTYDTQGRVTQQFLAGQGTSTVSVDPATQSTIISFPDGSTTTYTYDSAYRLTSIEDDFGHQTYTYQDDRLTAYQNQSGDVTTYVYDPSGNITEVHYPDTTQALSTYNDRNQLTRVLRPDGTTVSSTYDSAGNLRDTTDALGNTTTYTYNANHDLVSSTDTVGNTTTYTHGPVGEILTATNALGHTSLYAYNSAHLLTQVTDPQGATTQYTYTSSGALSAVTDALGNTTNYEYDSAGNMSGIQDVQGNTTTTTYNVLGQLISSISREGNEQTYAYDQRGHYTGLVDAEGNQVQYQYDSRGRVNSVTDPNTATTGYAYQANNRVTSVTAADGSTYGLGYDSMNRLQSVSNARGQTATARYDSLGRVSQITDALGDTTSYTYDPNGNMTGESDADGNWQTYTYDSQNRQTSSTDPLGNTTTATYDEAGQVVTTTDPLGGETNLAYDMNGRVTSATNASQGTTSYVYDPLGRTTQQTNPDGTSRSFAYDSVGNISSITTEDGSLTTFSYDKDGRLLSQTDAAGNVTSVTYDKNGRELTRTDALGQVTSRAYDKNGNVVRETDALGNTTTYAYNARNQVTSITDADGHVTKHQYDADGHVVAVTNPNGAVTRYAVDALGRVTSTTDPVGNVTRTTYDRRGNVAAQTDARGNAYTYTYDSTGQMTSETDPTGARTTYEYDSAGHVVKTTDARGAVTVNDYDNAGRVTSVTDCLGHTLSVTYDSMDQVVTMTDALGAVTAYTYTPGGKIASITDPRGGVTTYAYDVLGNTVNTTDPLGRSTTYAYDQLSRITQVTDPLGNTQSFIYDAGNHITEMTDQNGTTTTYTYNASGNVVQVQNGLGAVTTFSYDAMGQLVSMSANRRGPGDLDELEITQYAYDQRGLLTKKTDALGNSTTYTYDSNGYLTHSEDADGFITEATYDTRHMVSAINTYTTGNPTPDKTASFTYDAGGNLTVSEDWTGKTSFDYNLAGQLTRTIDPDGNTVGYTYDALGNQTGIIYPDNSTVTKTYDELSHLTGVTYEQGRSPFGFDDPEMLPARITPDPQAEFTATLVPTKLAIQQTSYTYDLAGQRTSVTYPNKIKEDFTYDDLGHVSAIHKSSPTQAKYLKYRYAYDPVGNVTYQYQAITGSQPAQIITYEYDALGQMSASQTSGGPKITYDYDTVGNLVTETEHWNSTYQEIIERSFNNLNQLTGTRYIDQYASRQWVDSARLNTYDKRGNLVEVRTPDYKTVIDPIPPNTTVARYTYDSTNTMVTGVNEVGETSTYQVNSLGGLVGQTMRIKKNAYGYTGVDAEPMTASKKDALIEDRFTLDYTNPLLSRIMEAETNGLTYKYVYGLDKISVDIDSVSVTPTPTQIQAKSTITSYFYQHDRQSSTDTLTDTNRLPLSSADYSVWGVPQRPDTLAKGLRKLDLVTEFTGYEYDPVLKIYDAKTRMYDPVSAQMQSTDAYWNPGNVLFGDVAQRISNTPSSIGGIQIDAASFIPDPLATRQSVNTYSYVLNNPGTNTDPNGSITSAEGVAAHQQIQALFKIVQPGGQVEARVLVWGGTSSNPYLHTYIGRADMVNVNRTSVVPYTDVYEIKPITYAPTGNASKNWAGHAQLQMYINGMLKYHQPGSSVSFTLDHQFGPGFDGPWPIYPNPKPGTDFNPDYLHLPFWANPQQTLYLYTYYFMTPEKGMVYYALSNPNRNSTGVADPLYVQAAQTLQMRNAQVNPYAQPKPLPTTSGQAAQPAVPQAGVQCATSSGQLNPDAGAALAWMQYQGYSASQISSSFNPWLEPPSIVCYPSNSPNPIPQTQHTGLSPADQAALTQAMWDYCWENCTGSPGFSSSEFRVITGATLLIGSAGLAAPEEALLVGAGGATTMTTGAAGVTSVGSMSVAGAGWVDTAIAAYASSGIADIDSYLAGVMAFN